ncbi:MAG TPA: phosphatidate cytidylyltransferase [Clostridia bacterium]|nr:phosphatidate cytidylyltransferase [Clostridia bacterium]
MLPKFLTGFGIFVVYYVIIVFLFLIIRALFHPPRELFRKMLHIMCAMSIFIVLHEFDTWYLAILNLAIFSLALYPIISYLERFPKVMEVLVQRKSGEIRSSLVLVYVAMSILIVIFWGWLGEQWKYIIVASIMAWGFGDSLAALVGKAYGKNKIKSRFTDGKKTVEGTTTMSFAAFIAVFVVLLIYTSFPWYLCLLAASIVAPISALVELISHHGFDTITVPLSAAVSLYFIMILFSFMGIKNV